jgi:hypothetical protein
VASDERPRTERDARRGEIANDPRTSLEDDALVGEHVASDGAAHDDAAAAQIAAQLGGLAHLE